MSTAVQNPTLNTANSPLSEESAEATSSSEPNRQESSTSNATLSQEATIGQRQGMADMTDAEKAEADRLYEERIEDEYAKREGGA